MDPERVHDPSILSARFVPLTARGRRTPGEPAFAMGQPAVASALPLKGNRC